jgi:hypothetical protein
MEVLLLILRIILSLSISINLFYYTGSCSDGDSTYRSLLESNLTIEVGLIVLDAVGLFCLHFKEVLLSEDGDNPLMRKVLDIYLSFLQIGQSESLSKHVFAALRAFINSFPLALYQGIVELFFL